jgi:hypothetical protein
MEINRSLAPAQWVEGRVLQADTGKPVAHALLTVYASDSEFGSSHGLGGKADAEGRFRINPYSGKFYIVSAYAPDGEPYLGVQKRVKWPAGKLKESVELRLPRGVLVRGKVTEAPSGNTVAGAAVQYIPRRGDNPFFRRDVITDWQAGVETAADGTFQMPVLPGPGHLMVISPTGEHIHQEVGSSQFYNGKPGGMRYYPDGLVKLDLAEKEKVKGVAVTLRRGVTVRGRVLGPDGKPVHSALMICRLHVTTFSPFWRFPVEVRDGRFELPGLDPEKSYPVHFLDPKTRCGATVTLSGKQASEAVTVRLGPCGQAKARIVGTDGKPLANHRPTLEIVVTPGALRYDVEASRKGELVADSDFLANIDRHNYWKGPQTDAEGRVTFPALVPGVTYRLLTVRGGKNVLGREFTVTAGKTLNLGDVVTSQGE